MSDTSPSGSGEDTSRRRSVWSFFQPSTDGNDSITHNDEINGDVIAPSTSERNGDAITTLTSNKRRRLFDYATAGAVLGGVPEDGRPDEVDG